jgi:drug/metabolite transporter (DMT)-like permease
LISVSSGDAFAIASAVSFAGSGVLIARGRRPGVEDNGAFTSLLVTTAIAGGFWLALGIARGFAPVTARGLLWFAGAGVLTAYVGRVAFYATVERLGAMRAATLQRLNPFFAVVLGIAVLHESIAGRTGVGVALIVASFAVLVLAARGREGAPLARLGPVERMGYVTGIVSALGYSTGYLLRKMGLAEAHDAFLGAAVGCAVGAILFAATAPFNARYAAAVRATFTHPNPWFVGSGVLGSAGQVLYFAALNELPMSRVALIVSMEVFVTLFLGYAFLRRRERLTPGLVIAAILGVAGTAFIVGT